MNKVKFSQIATFVAGQSPESKYYSSNPNDGIPFLQGNRTFGMFYPTFDTYTSKVTKEAKKGDILMSVRAPVGDLNFAPCDLCIGRGLSAIRANDGDNDFLFYALKYNIQNLIRQSSGTTFDSVNKDVVNNMDMIVPEDSSSYNKISSLLRTIDNRIENNNKVSAELESLAKTIYDYWFLQFEFPNEEGKPYKSSGGKMVWNEKLKREIPEGWEVKNVSDLATITWGQCPAGDNILPLDTELESIDYCSGGGDMHGGFLVDCQAKTNDSKRSAKDNDILVSIAGAIGNMCVVDHDISLGRAAMAYTVKKQEYLMCLYLSLKSLNKKITTVSTGSIQKVINSNHIKDFNVVFNEEAVKEYSKIANPIFLKLKQLSKENQELASLRDWLLPMLMNGQVTFK